MKTPELIVLGSTEMRYKMITFTKYNEQFIIENGEICYVFYITKEGVLQHLYFGEKLDKIQLESITNLDQDWSRTYYDEEAQEEKTYTDFYYAGRSMEEIPSFGFADKRGAPFIIENSDGTRFTSFRYVSHRFYEGKPQLEKLPSFRESEDCGTLEITLKDKFKDIYLISSFTMYKNINAILRNQKIVNKDEDIIIRRAYSYVLDLPSADFSIMHFPGDWINERKEVVEELNHGLKRLYSNMGRSSHEQNPAAILISEGANQEYGECFGFSFVYSGNFNLDFNVDKLGMTRVMMGISDEDFAWNLKKGEEFVVPEGIIVYSNSGISGVTNTFHNIIREHLINPRFKYETRPILLNSWEGCYMDYDTKMIIEYIDAIKTMDLEMFVLDDGWFGKRNDDSSSLGDWSVNTKKIDLAKIIEHTHKAGLKFGLWFEPEMINYDSDLYRQHPEYALGYANDERPLSRHQFVLDTVNEAAINNIYLQIKAILDNYKIDYVKWDHNRNIYDAYSQVLNAKQQGETYHRLMLGSYELMARLTRDYPDVLFESCASGGGRYDLGMLYYMPQVWTSDEMDPLQRLFIQYSTSRIYPLSTMGAHIGKQVTASYEVKAKISALGIYGLELDPRTLNTEDIEAINQVTKKYKSFRDSLIYRGRVFHLKSPYTSNFMALQSVSETKEEAVVLITNVNKETIKYRFLRLKGLDANKYYKNSYDNMIFSGAHYMKVGINLSKGRGVMETNLINLIAINRKRNDNHGI